MRVPAGQRHAIIGPNGAGKTTLFGCLTGAVRPTGGRITLFGRDVTGLAEHRRAAMGIGRTYQITNLFPASPCSRTSSSLSTARRGGSG